VHDRGVLLDPFTRICRFAIGEQRREREVTRRLAHDALDQVLAQVGAKGEGVVRLEESEHVAARQPCLAAP
jgi:hypothetical protein